jgi:chemotaxis methyl-accepting protein methylase
VYSLRLLWERPGRSPGPLPGLEITATDLDPTTLLERARQGVYPASSLLTYHTEPRIRPVLEALVRSLAPGGRLIVDSHESLPPGELGLAPCPRIGCAYRKRPERQGRGNRNAALD